MRLHVKIFSVVAILVFFHEIKGQTSTSINITEDAAVYFRSGTTAMSNNYGTNANLHVLTGTASSSTTIWRSFLRIDISSLSTNSVITEALLNLQAISTSQITGSNEVILHLAENTWVESTLTWNNQPSFDINVDDPVIPAGTNGMKQADITHWVRQALAAGQDEISIVLKLVTEVAGQHRKMSFASSDHATSSYHPKLEVEYYPNKIFTHTDFQETNNIYQFAWAGLNIKVDKQFVSHTDGISYEILDAENQVQVQKNSSNIAVDQCYIEIDDTGFGLSPGQVYSLVLYNENDEKRFLKFIK